MSELAKAAETVGSLFEKTTHNSLSQAPRGLHRVAQPNLHRVSSNP